MPTSEEIENIRATAAEAYSINLEKLDQDSVLPPASLPTPTSSSFIPQPFSLEVYQKALSRGSFFNDFLALQDFKFFDISKDTLIRDRLVEQNLEDAVRYLQNCVALRKEYGEIAKLFLDTHVKLEEFFRLDKIHTAEVAAGLYDIPYEEAAANARATDLGNKAYLKQNQLVDDLYRTGSTTPQNEWSGILSRGGVQGRPGVDASIAAATALASQAYVTSIKFI